MRRMIVIAAVVALLIGITSLNGTANGVLAASQKSRDRLGELDDSGLSRIQKVALGVELLHDEIADPTPDPLPNAADTRSHDAVLAHIVRKLRDADEAAIRASWRSAGGELKETLAVLALLQGEAAAGDEVREYVLNLRHRVNMRLLAAEGLAGLAAQAQDGEAARELGRTFAQVLHEDPQWRPLGGGKAMGEYPVRKLAAAAIKTLQGRGVRMESFVTAAAVESVLEFDGSPEAVARN